MYSTLIAISSITSVPHLIGFPYIPSVSSPHSYLHYYISALLKSAHSMKLNSNSFLFNIRIRSNPTSSRGYQEPRGVPSHLLQGVSGAKGCTQPPSPGGVRNQGVYTATSSRGYQEPRGVRGSTRYLSAGAS